MKNEISQDILNRMKQYQRDEMTAYVIYTKIAEKEKDSKNKETLLRFAKEEKAHAEFFEKYTGEKVMPSKLRILWYTIVNFLLGYTFTIKVMEKNENFTIEEYERIADVIPEVQKIIEEEQKHEDALIDLLDEERLQYVGAMVLGLNDALVELTGTIAGLTFALADTKIVALSGIVTGISATLSMAASNYLAENAEGNDDAFKSSLYTGVAYLVTVILMVLPYLLLPSYMYKEALVIMLVIVVLIIFVFNYYISVAKSQPFKKNFLTMTVISLGVAVIAFVIGLIAKQVLGIDI